MAANGSPFTHHIGNMLASIDIGTSTSIPSTTSTSNTANANSAPPPSMSALFSDQLTFRGLDCVLRLCCHARGMQALPPEVLGQIHCLVNPAHHRPQQFTITEPAPEPAGPRGDPAKPPPRDIFTEGVPAEIRMQIFATWLPAKDVVVKPLCGPDSQAKDPKRQPKRNKTSDMMIVCKKIKDEMRTCCYEERTFAIHIHEGLTTGGVEAFDAGRQPLQYQDSYVDDRFARFGDKDEFGFKQLKKVEITFFPTSEDARFTTINTFYMSRALAGLLERGGKKESRIVSITFKFAKGGSAKGTSDRRSILAREHRWWDPDSNKPRSTALGFISDIELVLRPFAILDRVHNVRVELPAGADSHVETVRFVSTLVARMTGGMFTGGSFADFDLHDQAEQYVLGKRDQLEAEIYERKYGNNSKSIPNITESDFLEADEVDRPDDTEVPRRTKRRFASLMDSADEVAQEEQDLIDRMDSVEERSRRSRIERGGRLPLTAEMKKNFMAGTGRRLGSLPSSANGTIRRRLTLHTPAEPDAQLAAMMQFREQTGVGSDVAREWLVTAGWSLTEALSSYNAGRAASSGYAPSTIAPRSLPSSSAVQQFCSITGEGVARGREYLYGARGSVESALSRYYHDSEAGRTSREETAITDPTSIMPEGAVLHQPRISLSSSVDRGLTAIASLDERTPEFGEGRDGMKDVGSVTEPSGEGEGTDSFDLWGQQVTGA